MHVSNVLDAVLLLAVAAFVLYPWVTGRRRRDWLRPIIGAGLIIYSALRITGVLAVMVVSKLVYFGAL